MSMIWKYFLCLENTTAMMSQPGDDVKNWEYRSFIRVRKTLNFFLQSSWDVKHKNIKSIIFVFIEQNIQQSCIWMRTEKIFWNFIAAFSTYDRFLSIWNLWKFYEIKGIFFFLGRERTLFNKTCGCVAFVCWLYDCQMTITPVTQNV